MTIELKITLKIDRKKKSPAKPPKKKTQSDSKSIVIINQK